MMRTGAIVVAGLGWALMAGCERAGDPSAPSDGAARPSVIAVSIYPLASLIQTTLAGDGAQVICLMPAGASPHTFEPTAADMREMRRADAVVVVGLGLDDWAVNAAQAAGKADAVIDCGELLGMADEGHDHHDHADQDHHHHGPVDPHIWLDPVLARKLMYALAEQWGMVRPNADTSIGSIDSAMDPLDKAYREKLAPFRGRKIVTYHSAFNRLAERYGLTVAATLEPAGATGTLSREALRDAMAAIEQHDLKVIFAEPHFPPAAIDMLKEKTGVQVLVLDPIGDPNSQDRNGYLPVMRYNLHTLAKGLSID